MEHTLQFAFARSCERSLPLNGEPSVIGRAVPCPRRPKRVRDVYRFTHFSITPLTHSPTYCKPNNFLILWLGAKLVHCKFLPPAASCAAQPGLGWNYRCGLLASRRI